MLNKSKYESITKLLSMNYLAKFNKREMIFLLIGAFLSELHVRDAFD